MFVSFLIRHFVSLQTCDRMERDRLVQFLSKLILHRRNVSELLEWSGIRYCIYIL